MQKKWVTKTPHRHAIALMTVLLTSKQKMTGSDIRQKMFEEVIFIIYTNYTFAWTLILAQVGDSAGFT